MLVYRNSVLSSVFAFATAFLAFRYYKTFQEANNARSFKVVNLPNRGKGLQATRDILQGEMIFKEEPLFIVRAGTFTDLQTHLPRVISGLNESHRSVFLQLSHPLKPGHADAIEAIFQTNSIKIDKESAGVFPLTARINHGCSKSFNSVPSWRKDGTLAVHALRYIKKGEEILREYIDTRQIRKSRQDQLYDVYAFDCSCSVCSLSPGDSERSDTRLSSMATIHARFSNWEKDDTIDAREAVRLAKRVWALGEKEGYWVGRGRLAEDVVQIAATHQDAKAVQQWAGLSSEWYSFELGYDSVEAGRMRDLMSEPSEHPSWASREELRIGSPEIY